MPTQTFFNLSEEKQNKIVEAAVKELSEVPFADASINQIIKNAGISRGSFYMYFDDKYDLLRYLMQIQRQQLAKKIVAATSFEKRPLKEVLIMVHKVIFEMSNNEQNQKFFRNIMVFFQGRPIEEIRRIQKHLPMFDEYEYLIQIIDTSTFKNSDKKSIVLTLDIAFSIIKTVIFQSAIKELSYEESKESLINYLDILEVGYGKGTESC